MPLTDPGLVSVPVPSSGYVNFLENLPGGRAGEANRSDPQSGVSRQIPVNVPAPAPAPEKPVSAVYFGRPACAKPGLRPQLDETVTRVSDARATAPAYHPNA
jgi:hypothetical protein